MKLITWNTAGRTKLQAQLDHMLAHNPDTLCLQEVIRSAIPSWEDALASAGFTSRFEVEPDRTKGVSIATRLPMSDCPTPALPRSDAITGAICGGVPVWSVHIPNGGTNGRIKIDCIQAVCEAAEAHEGALVIAGDFNAPQIEYIDGSIITWGQTRKGNLKKRLGTERGEWDRIERMAFEGLPARGLRNIWQDRNPTLIGQSPTWQGRKYGYRLDHVFSNLPATSATHEDGLSDHKMVVVLFTRKE